MNTRESADPGDRERERKVDGLERLLSENARLRPLLSAIAALGDDARPVYLVGGTVRDLLLGRERFELDLDIAVEGDAGELARKLAAVLGGRVTSHLAFGTAIVRYGDDERIDVVSMRRESYATPGALPAVERGTLQDDLHRRDFTVNAMAVAIAGPETGELVDPFGGRSDLEQRTLRVLHDDSFVDDPTRLLRGVRYEARYGFRFDERTLRLARSCVESGLLGVLSPARLRDELCALLEDEGAPAALARLGELGIERAIDPRLRANGETVAIFTRSLALREELDLETPAWRIGLEVLAGDLTGGEALGLFERLSLRRRDLERMARAVALAPAVVERLGRGAVEPAEVVALVEQSDPDAALLALARAELPQLRDYFARLRTVRLEIGGSELAELGLRESPRVGHVLAELRRRKLNGELDDREDELAAARELVAQTGTS